jgi:hypothetical protein
MAVDKRRGRMSANDWFFWGRLYEVRLPANEILLSPLDLAQLPTTAGNTLAGRPARALPPATPLK